MEELAELEKRIQTLESLLTITSGDRLHVWKRQIRFGDNQNYIEFQRDGTFQLFGNATTWEDFRFPVQSVRLSSTKPPTWTTYKGSKVLAFADQAVEGNEEEVSFLCQLPHGWKEGSDISPHVHWVGEDNTAGNVRWQMTHSWANIGSVFPGETTIEIDHANGATDTHLMAVFADIAGTGKTLSSIILCTLSRNSSHANDTFAGKDAYLLEIDFHLEKDMLGSRLIATK